MTLRYLYTTLLYLLMPAILLRLAYRGLSARAYWRRWPERYGFFKQPPPGKARRGLWIHAVSVGEAQAAVPIVEALLQRYPHVPVTITTTTPTGLARVQAHFGERVSAGYLPYDLPRAIERFLSRVDPRVAIIMETELWPNLFVHLRRRSIPIVVANARLSARSARGYRRIAPLTRETLAQITLIAAQDAVDAHRFVALGARNDQVVVTGSVKFDVTIPEDLSGTALQLRQRWGISRPVWIAASTRRGEEVLILEAFTQLRHAYPQLLLILVPRHPERFDEVVTLTQTYGFNTARRSRDRYGSAQCDVFIGDTMGELLLLYHCADVAFVGGTLVATGGHNVLEPAAVGIPTVVGPHTFNFAQITALLLEANALQQIQNPQQLAPALQTLLANSELRLQMGRRGRELVQKNRGATQRVVGLVERLMAISSH